MHFECINIIGKDHVCSGVTATMTHPYSIDIICITKTKAIVQDTVRPGVWLGWHIRKNGTRMSQEQLRENRNLS
jgi:hypothetical protein